MTIAISSRIQGSETVAYLGPKGTNSEQAARKYFSTKARFFAVTSIAEVFRAVEMGASEYGVVPVENSLEGSVHATLDLLLESSLIVYGEVELRIEHSLIVKPGQKMGEIHLVLSHPQALAQCRRFLEKNLPKAELREVNSTALAVELIKNMDHAAAIGTEIASENGSMEILARGIEDNPNNFTRFFILCKDEAKPSGRDKTSIIFSAKNIPGVLYKILGAFAIREINLTKIESRPERGKPWEYVFYLDFEGHRSEEKSEAALKDLQDKCLFVKVIGSYPRAVA
ncbi:MAG: hypothetical protein QG670_1603 [Thermoproteota archaeon]|nr:hypothetical protein [Thermoproteota archaeon]